MDENLTMIKKQLQRVKIIVLMLALMLAIGTGYSLEKIAAAQSATQAQLPTPQDLSRTFVGIAKQVKPAVVNIDTVEEVKRSTSSRQSNPIPFFDFGDSVPRRQRGTGSGVIISQDGYILTNNHVAGNASKLKVKLTDGREFTAKLVGSDPETDLAVIKIDAQSLPFAKLGDSEKVEQGEWVIALGSPFGLEQTMTAGIVSALGRDLGAQAQFTKFIQTDASINPGNSGGPLVNMNGEIIGINSMIFSRSGASEGVGFAIPSSLASKVYSQIVKNGKVTRAYLGVNPRDLTPAIARSLGYKGGTTGALIANIPSQSGPAAKAGLQSGDIITEVDGKAIKTSKELVETVADLPVGKQINLKFVREGTEQSANVVLAERPKLSDNNEEQPEENEEENSTDNELGISVVTVTPQMASQLNLKVNTGVVVQAVKSDSPAAEAGLQRGVVIHRVEGKLVRNRAEWMSAIASLKGQKEIALQIERSGGQFDFVTVTLD
ncbi:MAG: Do family serine endopeptidase [Acidobacteriota bacterium]